MIARNTLFNVFGYGAPLLVAVVAIPPLIDALGTPRFGVLTLIWAIVSYLSLFDMGLGRTLTLQLAVAESRGEHKRIGSIVTTGLALLGGLGLFAGVLMVVLAETLVGLFAGQVDRAETVAATQAMGIAMPAIILTSGLRGILEARGAFGLVNVIRVPVGVFTYLGPLVAVSFGPPRLDLVAWVLVAGRYAGLIAHAWPIWKQRHAAAGPYRFFRGDVAPLLSVGGWLTISGVVGPFMGYVDRFVIGALMSATAVAYYATPQEIVTKMWIIPGALTGVLLPAFAARIEASSGGHAWALFDRSLKALFDVLLPLCAALALFAHEILAVWIGPEFAQNSAPLLRVFAIGILINSLAHVPYTLIQSSGRSRTTGLVHMVELVPFVGILWWATLRFGVSGAVVAWLLRVVIDATAMFLLAAPLAAPGSSVRLGRSMLRYAAVAAVVFAGAWIASPLIRAVWLATATAVACFGLKGELQLLRGGRTTS